MTKTSLSQLQKATNEISASQNPQEKIASLTKAFDLFSKETARLESAYAALKEQFKAVNLELEVANFQLSKKVIELDAVSHYLNSILGNISQGILFIDLNGVITTYNQAAEQILETDKHLVLFNSFWENFSDDLFGFSLREALSTRKSPSTTFASLVTQQGIKRELETDTTFVLKDNQSDIPTKDIPILELTQGLIILIRDMTDLRRLQVLANRNDRMKELGEMAARVAHEIRNPLGGIKGFASLLQRDLKNQPEQQQMASYIVEGTDNLNRLVTNVLNYSRPVLTHFEIIDIVSLIRDLKHHVEVDSTLADNIKIEIETSYDNLICPIDPQLFKSAILNLIVNSIQAMPDGGKILINLNKQDNMAVIAVSDTGLGIPQENLEKIFSPFFTTKIEGNGFGLAEVHKVIQAHGGTIEVSSVLGTGTIFTIKTPLKIQ